MPVELKPVKKNPSRTVWLILGIAAVAAVAVAYVLWPKTNNPGGGGGSGGGGGGDGGGGRGGGGSGCTNSGMCPPGYMCVAGSCVKSYQCPPGFIRCCDGQCHQIGHCPSCGGGGGGCSCPDGSPCPHGQHSLCLCNPPCPKGTSCVDGGCSTGGPIKGQIHAV